MPSSIIVSVAIVKSIRNHKNADRLEIIEVLGWQCAVKKGNFSVGDRVIFFPPDTLLPLKWADLFGVTPYLGGKKHNRVRQINLRGEASFGLVIPYKDIPIGILPNVVEIDENVADFFDATKYEPPIRLLCGDAEKDHPLFIKYTKIENMRNYPLLLYDMQVVISEKVDGSNVRVGMIESIKMAGSHAIRRKEPKVYAKNLYWYPWSIGNINKMLEELGDQYTQVILFGEVYGGSVQSLAYGIPKGKGPGFRAFDLFIDGEYMDYQFFYRICNQYGIEQVPVLEIDVFNFDHIKALSIGSSMIQGASNIREGIVVKPVIERNCLIGRLILKYLSDKYLLSKHSDYLDK